jgi:hypothetical protein
VDRFPNRNNLTYVNRAPLPVDKLNSVALLEIAEIVPPKTTSSATPQQAALAVCAKFFPKNLSSVFVVACVLRIISFISAASCDTKLSDREAVCDQSICKLSRV